MSAFARPCPRCHKVGVQMEAIHHNAAHAGHSCGDLAHALRVGGDWVITEMARDTLDLSRWLKSSRPDGLLVSTSYRSKGGQRRRK